MINLSRLPLIFRYISGNDEFQGYAFFQHPFALLQDVSGNVKPRRQAGFTLYWIFAMAMTLNLEFSIISLASSNVNFGPFSNPPIVGINWV